MMKLNVVIFRATLLCLALVATLGCRRSLHDNPPTPPTPTPIEGVVPVEITFDWSQSGLDATQIERASARIFPEAGGEPIEVILTGDLNRTTVSLAPGAYRAVGINETLSVGDWTGIDFSGLANCDDFSASMRLLSGSRAAEVLVGTGNHLAVAPAARFEVTQAMVGEEAEQKPPTVAFTPVPITQKIRVIARIQNLDNARSFTATLSGMYATRSLWSGAYSEQRAMHNFEFTSRTYDVADPRHGTIETQFYVFKLIEGEDFTKKLFLTASLLNGEIYQQEFEVTRRIEMGELIYELKLGIRADDDPIILPAVPEGYVSVHFNLDWNSSYLSPVNGQVRRASVWIYPKEIGAVPIELVADPDVLSVSTKLKAGSYSVVAFNERKNPLDWTGLDIVDAEASSTIVGRVRSLPSEPLYTAKNVEPLVGAVLSEFTVAETPKTEKLVLKPVTHLLEVQARVENLDNARMVSCRLEGMASGTFFSSNNDVAGTAAYLFDLTDRTYDVLDRRNGVIKGKLYIFGDPMTVVSANQRMLNFTFTLLDGQVEEVSVDAASLFTTVTSGYQYRLEVTGGLTLTERPRLPIEGDPSVGDWPNTDTNHPLK